MAIVHGEGVHGPLTIRLHGQWTIVVPPREVDPSTAPHLEAVFSDLLSIGASHVAVDWRGVTFFDSVAFGVLLGVHRALFEAGGRFAVIRQGGVPSRLFELMGLDQVLTLVRTIDELN